jgi:Ca-activated chloride channel homolog
VKAEATSVASKTVVFVLDKSGSMSGQKIEQARNALKFVLNNLRDGDTFNIIAYDDKVESFKPELQRFDADMRTQAIRYVENIRDGGSTNINGALQAAFNMIGDTRRPAYVIFLTDGLPTAGVTGESEIAANARNANRSKARLCVFGVGYDVNARLLDRLSTENAGTTEYVKPAEDIEAAVARFYGRITAPVLTNVKVELANSDLNRIYPKETPDLFSGSQIVLAGRYRTAGATTLRITGSANDKLQTFEFPVSLAEKSNDDSYGFVEKLWATRRVGEIINELDLKGRNAELIDELVRLSTKHGILTPYTAFLADERTDLHAVRANGKQAELNSFDAPDSFAQNASGAAGVNLRGAKGQMQRSVQVQSGQQGYVNAEGKYQLELGCTVVGNTAMFKRNGAWVDPSVTPDEEKKAEVVEQFSERYFELARDNGNLRRFLSLPEGCTVRDGRQVYKVVQPKGG